MVYKLDIAGLPVNIAPSTPGRRLSSRGCSSGGQVDVPVLHIGLAFSTVVQRARDAEVPRRATHGPGVTPMTLMLIWYGLVLVAFAELLIAWVDWRRAIPFVLVPVKIVALVVMASITLLLFPGAYEATDDDGSGRP
jgi:hypothetical protein